VPHEIKLDMLPGGIALQAAKKDERALIQCAGIATSEDGELLIRYLEFAGRMLDQLREHGHSFARSQVDNFLAIIRRDQTTTVYVNELQLVSKVRVARDVEAGTSVFKDDIVDIAEARFDGITIPDDAGVIVVISDGWRKAVLFDFAPLGSTPTARHYDIWPMLGQLLARLGYQELFSISDNDWKALFACRWFPFVGLSNSIIGNLLGHVRAGWGASELLSEIKAELLTKLDRFLGAWKSKQEFSSHVQLLERAAERFKAEDYASCTALVFPRIEGLMRAHHAIAAPSEPRTQSSLSSNAVASLADNPYSLLLPIRFQEYLKDVFFAKFDETQQNIPISRNSIGHGVASAADYNLETAMLGLLICHQLFHSFPPNSTSRGSDIANNA